MIKLFLFLFLLFLTPNSYADEMYAFEKDDGNMVILTYINGSQKPLVKVLEDNNLMGKPFQVVRESDLPARADRKYWKLNKTGIGNKILIDTVKKQEDLDAQAAKEAEKAIIFEKLKITQGELDKLLGKK